MLDGREPDQQILKEQFKKKFAEAVLHIHDDIKDLLRQVSHILNRKAEREKDYSTPLFFSTYKNNGQYAIPPDPPPILYLNRDKLIFNCAALNEALQDFQSLIVQVGDNPNHKILEHLCEFLFEDEHCLKILEQNDHSALLVNLVFIFQNKYKKYLAKFSQEHALREETIATFVLPQILIRQADRFIKAQRAEFSVSPEHKAIDNPFRLNKSSLIVSVVEGSLHSVLNPQNEDDIVKLFDSIFEKNIKEIIFIAEKKVNDNQFAEWFVLPPLSVNKLPSVVYGKYTLKENGSVHKSCYHLQILTDQQKAYDLKVHYFQSLRDDFIDLEQKDCDRLQAFHEFSIENPLLVQSASSAGAQYIKTAFMYLSRGIGSRDHHLGETDSRERHPDLRSSQIKSGSSEFFAGKIHFSREMKSQSPTLVKSQRASTYLNQVSNATAVTPSRLSNPQTRPVVFVNEPNNDKLLTAPPPKRGGGFKFIKGLTSGFKDISDGVISTLKSIQKK